MTSAIVNDFFYSSVYTRSSGVDSAAVTGTTSGPQVPFVAGTLLGKQRNAFGSYIVVNKDPYQFEFWGYTATDADNVAWSLLFTTTAESSVQFLGSHEVYWWPYLKFLLAKVGDGSSFKFFRFNSNFQTTAGLLDVTDKTEQIEYTEHRLWQVPKRILVPPIFYQKMAYIYASWTDDASANYSPHLLAYEYNEGLKAPELKCDENSGSLPLIDETSQNLYHQYTFINVGEYGVIYKK